MIARQASVADIKAIQSAYALADLRCDPNHDPHPPGDLLRAMVEHGCVFVAEEDGIVGTALIPGPNDPEVRWLTILRGDPAQVWEVLGDAICEAVGEPHGVVHNPDLRAALLAHERLSEDPDEPERLRWRRP